MRTIARLDKAPAKPCQVCGKPTSSRRLLCNHHYHRKKTGRPLFTWRERFLAAHPPANGIALIPLTQKLHAVVDEADYRDLMKYRWHAHRITSRHTQRWYADTAIRTADGKKVRLSMHRLLLNAPAHCQVDHKNNNGLDNRRCNIRLASHAQNQWNKRSFRGSSRFKGVFRDVQRAKWRAVIRSQGKNRYLGSFESEVDAARAYDQAAKQLYGDFCHLNLSLCSQSS